MMTNIIDDFDKMGLVEYSGDRGNFYITKLMLTFLQSQVNTADSNSAASLDGPGTQLAD